MQNSKISHVFTITSRLADSVNVNIFSVAEPHYYWPGQYDVINVVVEYGTATVSAVCDAQAVIVHAQTCHLCDKGQRDHVQSMTGAYFLHVADFYKSHTDRLRD